MSDETIRKLERELARSGRSPHDYALAILDTPIGDRERFYQVLMGLWRHAPEDVKRGCALELLIGRAPGDGVSVRLTMNAISDRLEDEKPGRVPRWTMRDLYAQRHRRGPDAPPVRESFSAAVLRNFICTCGHEASRHEAPEGNDDTPCRDCSCIVLGEHNPDHRPEIIPEREWNL